jgi:large subunit ribosomal protein L22
MTKKTAIAYLKAVKSSPLKVMKVTRNVVGLPASEALKLLQFSNLKISLIVRKLIQSAVANAENNHNMDADELYIEKINVGRAFALKRFSARGRGRSSRILKTFSNIRVILAESDSKKLNKTN